MPRQTVKHEEDSGSDWDSMSEIGPPPTKHTQNIDRSNNERVAVPQKLKSMTFVDPHIDKTKDDPPYDFKQEVSSPHHSESTVKPGKGNKGRTYEPKHVTFEAKDNHNKQSSQKDNDGGGAPDSDSEDPLYSTVKPRGTRHKESERGQLKQPEPTETAKHTAPPHQNHRKLPSLKNIGKRRLEGVDNAAYVGDDHGVETQSRDSHEQPTAPMNPPMNSVRLPQTQSMNREDELMMREYEAHLARNTDNRGRDSRECSPPLIMAVSGGSSIESFSKSSVASVNRAMAEAFAVITFPFTCLSLFIHHFLRFLLQGILRPLFVDPLTLSVEFLIRPFVSGVVRPLLASINVAASSLSDTLLICVRPVTAVLKSFRLVEVNYTRRYSVEEI